MIQTICKEHKFGEVTTEYNILGEVRKFTELRCLNCGELYPPKTGKVGSIRFQMPENGILEVTNLPNRIVDIREVIANQNVHNAEKFGK